jgi:hypothetical protein
MNRRLEEALWTERVREDDEYRLHRNVAQVVREQVYDFRDTKEGQD